jgi:hypothetical protein
VTLESASRGLSPRCTRSYLPSLSFDCSTKPRDESVMLNGLQPIEHGWNSMHSDQYQPQVQI